MIIGVDVGGSSLTAGVVEFTEPIPRTEPAEHPIDSSAGRERILEAFVHVIETTAARGRPADDPPPAGLRLGFGFPGPFDYERGICYIRGLTKYEGIYGLDIGAELRERVPQITDIRFRNDAVAAVAGEGRYGVGAAYDRLLGLTLGTGMGSGYMRGGRIVTHPNETDPEGWLFPVPFRGARADDHFSTRGLQRRLAEAGSSTTDVATAAGLARDGGPAEQEAFRRFGSELAAFIAPYLADFDAQALVLLGGISRAFDLFVEPLRAGLGGAHVVTGTLGPKAAVLGAAALFDE